MMEHWDFFFRRVDNPQSVCKLRVFPLIVRIAEDSDKFNIPFVAWNANNKRLFKAGRNSLRSRRIAHCPVETMPCLSLLRHFIVVNPLMVAAFPRPTDGWRSHKVFLLTLVAFISGLLPATILNDRIVASVLARREPSSVAMSSSKIDEK